MPLMGGRRDDDMQIIELDTVGGPAVEVFEGRLPATAVSVTLWRLSGGAKEPVRGAIRKPAAGSLTHIDREVPLGAEATYRVESFGANGASLGFLDGASITLRREGLWVHNPLDPDGGVRCEFRGGAGFPLKAPNRGEVVEAPGMRAGIFLAGSQRGAVDIDLSIQTDTVEIRDKFLTMLGRGAKDLPPILCFRFGNDYQVPLPRPFYSAVPDYALEDVDVRFGGTLTHFNGTGDEVAPPAPGLFVPLLTYSHVNAVYKSYAGVRGDNLTYGAINRRYDLVTR